MNKGKTKAVLFDLDGTLVDSLTDIAVSMNEVLRLRGFPVHPVEAYRYFVGDGMENLVRRCLAADVDVSSSLVYDMLGEMKMAYAEHWRDHAVPYAGIRGLLKSLAGQDLRLGVFSNKPEAFSKEMVAFVFPEVPFDVVRGARNGVPIKPAPEGAQAILADWQLAPAEVMYVGDTNTDMATGKNTGMFTVGVTWGFRDREELERCGADAVVDSPEQILELLNSGYPKAASHLEESLICTCDFPASGFYGTCQVKTIQGTKGVSHRCLRDVHRTIEDGSR